MLRIHPQTSAADVKKYFDVADYYSEGQETVGMWGGELAATLGLSGRVTKSPFDMLCDNINPLTGGSLTPRTNDNRRIGYDFTFSGPKSFSILISLAEGRERAALQAIFDTSVTETMKEIEADMQTRVRLDGAFSDRPTGNGIWAAYNHTTARPVDDKPPDPHWHTHAFMFNATEDKEEGRIKAGEFSRILKDVDYYTAAFYARLAAKLQALGYGIDRRGGKEWEVAGITDGMIATFSKRTDEIEDEHTRRMKDDPDYRAEYKHELAAKTRSKKQKELTPEQLRRAWHDQLDDDECDALAAVYRRETAASAPMTAKEAVAYAVAHAFEREAVVDERELVRVALLYGLGDVSASQVRAELPGAGVMLTEKDGRMIASTKEAYGMERFVINHAKAGRGCIEAIGVAAGLERGILDDEQWQAVTALLTSCDKVQLVDSAAGVGKSTMLGVFDQGMRLAGRGVTYLATTTPAVGVLRDDGFDAETVAKFLLSDKMQETARGQTVVVDEASMLGLKDSYRLFSVAKEKHIRLIFLGDSRQHSSVSAGAFMRTLQQYGYIEPIRITRIKRQENEDHRAAVESLFAGKTLEGFDLLDKKLGWVHEIADDKERYRAMAQEYVDAIKAGTDWKDILLLSPTHIEGQRVTEAVRDLLKQTRVKGKALLGGEEHELTRWVACDMTQAERGDGRNYRPGHVDMVQFHQNAAGHQSGSRLEITKNSRASLPLDQAGKFQAYRKQAIRLAEGDILRFTAGGMTLDGHRIRNGSAYKIAGFTATGIRLDNGWLVSRDFGHFKHGIETSYGSQAKTVKLAIVGQSTQSLGASSMEQAYVTASRSKFKVSTYTDDKEAVRKAIQRSSLKLAAHDVFGDQRPSPQQAAWRQRLARLRHQALLDRNRADAEALRRRATPHPLPPSPHADRLRASQQERSQGHER